MTGPASSARRSEDADAHDLDALAARLKERRGYDLLSYKPRLLKRRLQVRLRARRCEGLPEYLAVLEADPDEWELLLKALNIHVSGFFRNEETFRCLSERVLPTLVREKKACGGELLMVSAGCAEGEEPYSLAMLMRHGFKKDLRLLKLRIVGVDIEEAVLARARAGVYDAARLKELPEDLKQDYFTAREGRVHLSRKITDMVEFRAHDIRKGLPFAGADLIMCRNVLIYFTREHQRGMLGAFGAALRPGGCLVLGKTESMLTELRSGFTVVDLSEHIYRKAGEEPCGWR